MKKLMRKMLYFNIVSFLIFASSSNMPIYSNGPSCEIEEGGTSICIDWGTGTVPRTHSWKSFLQAECEINLRGRFFPNKCRADQFQGYCILKGQDEKGKQYTFMLYKKIPGKTSLELEQDCINNFGIWSNLETEANNF